MLDVSNVPEDRGETWKTPGDSSEDRERTERQKEQKRTPGDESDGDEGIDDPREDPEPEGLRVNARFDPTRYVL